MECQSKQHVNIQVIEICLCCENFQLNSVKKEILLGPGRIPWGSLVTLGNAPGVIQSVEIRTWFVNVNFLLIR